MKVQQVWRLSQQDGVHNSKFESYYYVKVTNASPAKFF